PPDEGQGGGGAPVPASRVSTAGIVCDIAHDAPNGGLGLVSRYRWRCGDGQRVLEANGVPAHPVGAFPNPRNPNRIAEQQVSVALPLVAQAYDGTGWRVKVPGYALDGVRFDPGTAETCTDACDNGGRGSGGAWRIEALHQDFFDFGVDADNAHVQPGGAYHYHGIPASLLAQGGKAPAMTLIGWAVDGYPIYGRWGHAVASDPASALRPMRSSYRLKIRPDAGRPAVAMVPMGTFTQDYEYVAGSGDLDACNGRRDVTPEFPRGAYHYYVTDFYPYVQRCVMGKPARGTEQPPPPPWMRPW
ncbi:YHYH protein, partial [Sphingomonas sp. AR_OL41]|uniref:YHYH protein n=1 Tax=Sphingomonas sp. AR_OL41 TaxID=3042729 RepID=UPI0024815410